MMAQRIGVGPLLVLGALSAACGAATHPCAADTLACPGANEVCNVRTLQCEVHESCSTTIGGVVTVGACPDPARPRCADLLVAVPRQFGFHDLVYQPFCLAPAAAPVANGGACAVTLFEGIESGRDACADGLTCIDPAGGVNGRCMKLCATNAECGSTEACASFLLAGVQSRKAFFGGGICLPGCTLFGSDCRGTCVRQDPAAGKAGACVPPAAPAVGAECSPSRIAACAPGLSCQSISPGIIHEATCRALCDTAHPCPPSSVCAADSSGYGFCYP